MSSSSLPKLGMAAGGIYFFYQFIGIVTVAIATGVFISLCILEKSEDA